MTTLASSRRRVDGRRRVTGIPKRARKTILAKMKHLPEASGMNSQGREARENSPKGRIQTGISEEGENLPIKKAAREWSEFLIGGWVEETFEETKVKEDKQMLH